MCTVGEVVDLFYSCVKCINSTYSLLDSNVFMGI